MDIQKLFAENSSIVSLPSIFYQLQEAMANPQTSFEELGEIILYDTGLTARLLRIVNSAFYGFSSKIENISQAIGVIGTNQFRDLVLSTVVIDKFQGIPKYVMDMESFWKHSIACGLIAQKFALYNKELSQEGAFIGGMLHDIGQLVMCMSIPSEAFKIFDNSILSSTPLHQAELERLTFDHAQVGGMLLKKWNLPDMYSEMVMFHHQPNSSPNFAVEASIIYMADMVANSMKLGCSGESFVLPSLDKEAWGRVTFPFIKPSKIREEIKDSFEEAVGAFLQAA